ncbi:MAG: hypothetical protein AVDCRST_MAG91-1237 [uncultured Sphingomonadaceae bacterium]|uniref:Uncharacterized protein n=1 Tax=uncultured Sphingomonadaceae bacterium TaxID=169976 RepID=A0A6J4SSX7_9SPHN|nr:MAG: hypothetical protein AVDCRST_MAG91-1237 [uncultured Sphingomonadaceae bacterium]
MTCGFADEVDGSAEQVAQVRFNRGELEHADARIRVECCCEVNIRRGTRFAARGRSEQRETGETQIAQLQFLRLETVQNGRAVHG